MKTKKQAIFLLFLLICGCKKEQLLTYSSNSNIYFTLAANTVTASSKPTDSSIVTFAYDLPNVVDSIVKVSVSATGEPSRQDRQYKLVAGSASTAIAGVHYKALEDSYTLKAGKVRDTVRIVVYRKAELKNNSVKLDLQLRENADFKTNLQKRGDNLSVSYLNFRLVLNDILVKPPQWRSSYGKFSAKKLYLICEIGKVLPIMFTSTALYNDALANNAGILTDRYLEEQRLAGTPVLYEDGTPMRMND